MLPPAVAVAVQHRDRAAARYQAAVDKAAAAYRQALREHLIELEEPYRQACIAYAAAAAAVLTAAADGTDPAAALSSAVNAAEQGTVTSWPWLPKAPESGIDDLDATLKAARRAASRTTRSRGKAAPAAPPPPLEDGLLGQGLQLVVYADEMADLVRGGYLTRRLIGLDNQAATGH